METNVNWDLWKARCSGLGLLLTEPKLKADKEAGELSKTAKSYLIKEYIRVRFGRQRDINTKEIRKGLEVEDDSITLLSRVDKEPYIKNEVRKENEYLTGCCDIDSDKFNVIIDTKSSWDLETFIPKLTDDIDDGYESQGQGYMELYNRPTFRLCYVLVDTPTSILSDLKRKLLFSMNVVSEESPEYLGAVANLEKEHTFGDIPMNMRLISKYIQRDESFMDRVIPKVLKAREFLKELEEKHNGQYLQSAPLPKEKKINNLLNKIKQANNE